MPPESRHWRYEVTRAIPNLTVTGGNPRKMTEQELVAGLKDLAVRAQLSRIPVSKILASLLTTAKYIRE